MNFFYFLMNIVPFLLLFLIVFISYKEFMLWFFRFMLNKLLTKTIKYAKNNENNKDVFDESIHLSKEIYLAIIYAKLFSLTNFVLFKTKMDSMDLSDIDNSNNKEYSDEYLNKILKSFQSNVVSFLFIYSSLFKIVLIVPIVLFFIYLKFRS